MRIRVVFSLVLLIAVLGGPAVTGSVAAQGEPRLIPIPGILITAKTSPDGRLAAVHEMSQAHQDDDLVPDYLPVRLVDLDSEAVTPLPGPADYALDVAFSPDGAILAGCYGTGQIVLWDTASATQIKTLNLVPGLNRCAFFPDGRTLAVVIPVSLMSAFLVLDTDSGAITQVLSHRFESFGQFRQTVSQPQTYAPFGVVAFTVTPDGSQIVTSGMNDSLWVWDVAGAPPELLVDSEEDMPMLSIRELALTPDGSAVVYLHQRGPAIHAVRLADAVETTLIPLEERPFDFALASDGDRLALAYREPAAITLLSLSQPEDATTLDLALPEDVIMGFPVVAFASPERIVVAGLLAEASGQNALIVLDVP